jgi:signal transduction histidine kinase/GAF domain-containing protein
VPSPKLVTSHDPVLTALAQLGACQLGTARSLISLFDQSYQYVIAEATPTISLVPGLKHEDRNEDLWLCGTAIPRRYGVCEHTLAGLDPTDFEGGDDPTKLPLALVSDLTADPRFSSKPYCLPGTPARFYAAVPIRTHRGINIGVYCVIHTEPRDPSEWDDRSTQLMRGIAQTIMGHLEAKRSRNAHRRNERMNRGLGSFVEGKATLGGWRVGPNIASFEDNLRMEGALNANQQSIERDSEEVLARQEGIAGGPNGVPPAPPGLPQPVPIEREFDPSDAKREVEQSTTHEGSHSPAQKQGGPIFIGPEEETTHAHYSIQSVFSKATNIIREAIEIEGVLFLDASKRSFGASAQLDSDGSSGTPAHSNSNSSDEAASDTPFASLGPSAQVIGFSTSDFSSIDGAKSSARHTRMPEGFLSTLLRRYPRGRIFNFDENGELQSSDSSEDDHKTPISPSDDAMSPLDGSGERQKQRRRKSPWARQHEGSTILETFPGARSVAFVPVWNARKDRWFAGGFAYTYNPTRIFTVEGELSYLRAFGMLAMAETFRNETLLADKAKSDGLGSLSHELRSPLHGVVLGVELLNDTKLDAFQGNILHTLETCSRTLLDTVDHLLDHSKINNFMATMKMQKHVVGARGLRLGRSMSIEAGMTSLLSNVRLDVLCEEVLESVFAGFNFQYISIAQLAKQGSAAHADAQANRRMDSMQAMEELGPTRTDGGEVQLHFGKVSIFLDIDPTCAWTFYTQPGAIRRIIMNLFGNSLKYTKDGTIRVSLRQEVYIKRRRGPDRVVKITVADTGKGISEDYLRNDLFKPFAQEDRLAPGAGLGLSLVKQITSQFKGTITVDSRVGIGTTISVALPLLQVLPAPRATSVPGTDEDDEFEERVAELRGLRVRLVGFDRNRSSEQNLTTPDRSFNDRALIENILHAWLQMEVIPETQCKQLAPDLILCADSALGELSGGGEWFARPPSVVLCANALVAYQRSTSSQFVQRPHVFEFISQP